MRTIATSSTRLRAVLSTALLLLALSAFAVSSADAATNGKYLKVTDYTGNAHDGSTHSLGTVSSPFTTFSNAVAVINWGDGQTSTLHWGTGTTLLVLAGHSYASGGPRLVRISLTATACIKIFQLSNCSTQTDSASVVSRVGDPVEKGYNSTVAAKTPQLAIPASGPYWINTGTTPAVMAKATAGTINWGDGTSSAASLFLQGDSIAASGTHSYASPGTYNVTTSFRYECAGVEETAVRGSGFAAPPCIFRPSPMATRNVTSQIVVLGDHLTMTGTAISATEGAEFFGRVALAHTDNGCSNCVLRSYVDWGDGNPDDVDQVTKTGINGAIVIKARHTYEEQGTYHYSVQLQEFDPTGRILITSVTATGTATVDDAPLVAANGLLVPMQPGITYSGPIGHFTDASRFAIPGNYQILVDWGDGGSSAATARVDPDGGFFVDASHRYASAGNYTIHYRVRSTRGQESSAQSTARVDEPPLN